MHLFVFMLMLALPFTLIGQNAAPSNPDPLAIIWEVDRLTNNVCLLSIDLGHGDMDNPDFLSIYISIDTAMKQVRDVVLLVPDKADASSGLVMGFVGVGEEVTLDKDTVRVLSLKARGSDYYRIRLKNGIIPFGDVKKELSVIDCFRKYPMVAFMYWSNGVQMRVSTTLSEFQNQYLKVLNETGEETK